MSETVKFGSGLVGNQLIVHANRVEIISGCMPLRRRQVIPFSGIASVEVPRALNMVVIHTNDGRTIRYSVGNAKRIQEAILERM